MTRNDQYPLVSCVMPTYNRRKFVPHAIEYFKRQDYPNKELIIIDDGADAVEDLIPYSDNIRYIRLDQKITLGAKLNMACREARGSVLVNWDDDDWYAPWRLRYQVNSLQSNQTSVCGINQLLYLDLGNRKGFRYSYPRDQRKWLLGSSLCYTKTLWTANQFADIDVGMDGLFVWNTAPEQVSVLDDYSFSVHMIHSNNVSPKDTSGAWWNPLPVEELEKVMGVDSSQYLSENKRSLKTSTLREVKSRNIFACLVHEEPACVADLIRNLHYNDPDSVIILYNGGIRQDLFPSQDEMRKFQAFVHPNPVPMRHGYLHQFALDCMQYAIGNFDFDYLTIVDSDQLCIKSGYSNFLKRSMAGFDSKKIGLLSSDPARVDANNIVNHVALQAFREIDLWKPLLQQFEGGHEKFVHWTFWPSTVLTASAIKDLLMLFKTNGQLQEIMRQTQIWATEEVIFPTLVALLGYDVVRNPCDGELVRYKRPVGEDEIKIASAINNSFWAHPVARNYDDNVRKFIRERSNGYVDKKKSYYSKLSRDQRARVLSAIDNIEGWLSVNEANLLLSAVENACGSQPAPATLVEIGSYHGKATVLMATIIRDHFPDAKIISIDPHDGKLGAADQGLTNFPPSLDPFTRNLHEAKVTQFVDVICDHSQNISLSEPVAFLLIDGLHDYMNVSRDFAQFSKLVPGGGLVAFHDYANYFPGVKLFVDELLHSGKYKQYALADTLMVIQKIE